MSKWIVTKGVHLGFIKQTVGVGTIIEHDTKNQNLIIDGVAYSPTKDLDILKNHGFVEKYKKTRKDELKKVSEVAEKERDAKFKKFDLKKEKMPVVKSDADLQKEIDISHTIKKPRKAKKEENLEVIKMDETLQERVERKQTEIPEMPIVKDDSLGDNHSVTDAERKSKEDYEKRRQDNIKKAKEAEEKLKKDWIKKNKSKEFDKVTEVIETEQKDNSSLDQEAEKEIDAKELLPKEIEDNKIPDQDTQAYPVKRKRGRPKKAKKAVSQGGK